MCLIVPVFLNAFKSFGFLKETLLKCCPNLVHTATKIPLMFPFLGIARPSPNFHIHVSVSDLYCPRIGLHISSSKIGRPMVGIYSINHSQTHECGNWDWDPDIPFLGIFVSKFRYFVFAVQLLTSYLCVMQLSFQLLGKKTKLLRTVTRKGSHATRDSINSY